MQLTATLTLLAMAITGAMAVPNYNPPPPPAPPAHNAPTAPTPPAVNTQTIACSGGSPFCCSPTSTGGTTCKAATAQCNAIAICCNNNANGGAASQNCEASSGLQQPVVWDY